LRFPTPPSLLKFEIGIGEPRIQIEGDQHGGTFDGRQTTV
jgi:hypothetical protein